MVRPTILSLLVAAAACGSSAADAGAYSEAEVRAYVAARIAHQRAFDSLSKTSFEEGAKLDHAWVREYRPRLERIAGRLDMEGLTDSVTTNVGAMTGPYDNTHAPDGLVYRTTDSIQVFVSDTAIFRAWVTSGQSNLAELLRSPGNLGGMFSTEAGARRCADLPVSSTTKQVMAAMLIEYSQDPPPDCEPNTIVVSVVVGHRVFAAQQRVSDSLASDRRRAIDLAKAMIDRLPDR